MNTEKFRTKNAECGSETTKNTKKRRILMVRKKNSDVKPQNTLNSLKILYYSSLSVISVVKNSCSVILNLFQNLNSNHKGTKAQRRKDFTAESAENLQIGKEDERGKSRILMVKTKKDKYTLSHNLCETVPLDRGDDENVINRKSEGLISILRCGSILKSKIYNLQSSILNNLVLICVNLWLKFLVFLCTNQESGGLTPNVSW